MGGNGAAGRAAAERVGGLDGWDSPTDAVRWEGTGRLDGRPPRGSEGWMAGTLSLMPSDGRGRDGWTGGRREGRRVGRVGLSH